VSTLYYPKGYRKVITRQINLENLVRRYLESTHARKGGVQVQTGDDVPFGIMLSQRDLHVLKAVVPANSLLFIDEAQQILHIGQILKLLVDNIPGLEVIVTGSSSFE